MNKKKLKKGTQRPSDKLIKFKNGFANVDMGVLMYRNDRAHLRIWLDKESVIFEYYWDGTGLSFDFRIEGKKEVQSLVEFFKQAYETVVTKGRPEATFGKIDKPGSKHKTLLINIPK